MATPLKRNLFCQRRFDQSRKLPERALARTCCPPNQEFDLKYRKIKWPDLRDFWCPKHAYKLGPMERSGASRRGKLVLRARLWQAALDGGPAFDTTELLGDAAGNSGLVCIPCRGL